MAGPVSVDTPDRVIPRPSNRGSFAPAGATVTRADEARLADEPLFAALAPVGILAAAVAFGIVGMGGRAETESGVLIVPVLAAAVWLVLRNRTRNWFGDGFVAIVFAGFAVRLLASVPRLVGGVDSFVYHREGARLAESFRALDFAVATGRTVPGSGALRYFVGLVNVGTGSSFLATYLFFTVLAFAGQVLFLVGVRPVLTKRQFRILAVLLMLWPSLAFWPSSIGKESAVVFGLGLTTLGASRLYSRRTAGVLPLLAGLAAIGFVRPHVAMIVLCGLLIGLFSRTREGNSRVTVRLGVLVLVVVGSMWLTDVSASLFGLDTLDGMADVTAALDFAQDRTSQDQAAFTAPRVENPSDYPWAAVTVLLRPFPWEASNAMALASGVEGMVLSVLLVAAVPGLLAQRRALLSEGMLLNATVYAAVFVFLFSAIGNFGILSRQRVQVTPFILLIAAVGIGHVRARRQVQAAVPVSAPRMRAAT